MDVKSDAASALAQSDRSIVLVAPFQVGFALLQLVPVSPRPTEALLYWVWTADCTLRNVATSA